MICAVTGGGPIAAWSESVWIRKDPSLLIPLPVTSCSVGKGIRCWGVSLADVPLHSDTVDRLTQVQLDPDDPGSLALYLRDLGPRPVQQPGEEVAFAEALAAAEHELWRVLLTGPGAAAVAALDDKTPEAIRRVDRNRALRTRALELARVAPSAQHRRCVERATEAVWERRNAFVLANSRLVIAIAKDVASKRRRASLADLVQEGNIGLMQAVDRYDPSLGFRFSTYAVWWIRAAIGRAVERTGSDVYLPAGLVAAHRRVVLAHARLTRERGEPPTYEEARAEAGVSEDQLALIRRWVDGKRIQLDAPAPGAEGTFGRSPTWHELVPADGALEDVTSTVDAEDVRRILAVLPDLISELPPVEADVIRRRFCETPEPLWQIGQEYELSRERIRQVQASAVARLRRALEKRRMI